MLARFRIVLVCGWMELFVGYKLKGGYVSSPVTTFDFSLKLRNGS